MSKKGEFFKTYMAYILGLSVSNLIGYCGESFHAKRYEENLDTKSIVYENKGEIEILEPGEHVVVEKVESPLNESVQYTSHPGYKAVGFATSSYGRSEVKDGETCIMFINEDVVQASVTGTIDGKNYCSDFGIPIDYEKTIKEDLTTKTFAPGEHIISIPVSNIVDDGFVYECHEGYEPIGISTASHGKNFNIHTGSAVLYVNIEEVTCEKTEDNKYTEFGTPKEEVKVNIKK